MFGVGWVTALILLCLLAAAAWLIRRIIRGVLTPWRRRPSDDLDDGHSGTSGSLDWASQVLEAGRRKYRRDRGFGR